MTEQNLPPVGTPMHQISEEDLSELERIIPVIHGRLFGQLGKDQPGATLLRKQLGKVKEILSNVRWDYGPPLDVTIIPAGDE